MRKGFLIIFLFMFLGTFSSFGDGIDNQGLAKKGKFHKDPGFNKNNTRDLLPPDPGDDDPFPIPVGEGGLMLSVGFILFIGFKYFKNKSVDSNTNAI